MTKLEKMMNECNGNENTIRKLNRRNSLLLNLIDYEQKQQKRNQEDQQDDKPAPEIEGGDSGGDRGESDRIDE